MVSAIIICFVKQFLCCNLEVPADGGTPTCPEVVTHAPWNDDGSSNVEVLLSDGTYGSIQLPDGRYPVKMVNKIPQCPDISVGVKAESKLFMTQGAEAGGWPDAGGTCSVELNP